MKMGESDENTRLARSHTDPIWLQDHFLKSGHDQNTRNGTATFVAFRKRQFAATCSHVMTAASNPDMVPGAPHPTLALHVGKAVLNFSFFTQAGLRSALSAPGSQYGAQEVDIAIAELTGPHWHLLASSKGKTAIDLDNWREPNWPTVRLCYAAGYADEHKEVAAIEGDRMVSTPMLSVVAEPAGPIARDQRVITLSSRLDKPHGYYFSGMSGGALYTVEKDVLVPAGIVFEGYPSTEDEGPGRAESPAFLDQNDIFIRALTLTPDIFLQWLCGAKLAS